MKRRCHECGTRTNDTERYGRDRRRLCRLCVDYLETAWMQRVMNDARGDLAEIAKRRREALDFAGGVHLA